MKNIPLTEEEVDYLEKIIRLDYQRLAKWFEHGHRFRKMEEVATRMGVSESLGIKVRMIRDTPDT